MGLIDQRNGDLGIIEGRFIKHVLDDQADEILKDSKRGMKGFKSAKWNKNKMQVDSNTLTYVVNCFHFSVSLRYTTTYFLKSY